ncbi:hypothetical protein, partial [Sulfitobacter sp.]|uniref:hypothetical protein n=1 Tax=Sulfitobacter sp. TaxID=1903071 RepID=UPI003563827B
RAGDIENRAERAGDFRHDMNLRRNNVARRSAFFNEYFKRNPAAAQQIGRIILRMAGINGLFSWMEHCCRACVGIAALCRQGENASVPRYPS